MPRGGRGGSSRSPSRSTTTSSRPMPQTRPPPPPPQTHQPQSGGMFSGIGSTIMTGMAFGAGS